MKDRPYGFLSDEHIDHNGEIFDYIKELHEYLWKFIRTAYPGASGLLGNGIDPALEKLKRQPADRYAALLDAAVSLHHWLFEIVNDPGLDAPDDAQLALDKWDRFLDGKEE